ncbi:flagellar FlbD family protein [Geodermatophilus sp. DSM 44513]|uniref:flagellar FlbD family protein n=1 Tax=Geodermatophilus sp. DSM 44513 TaxID=1528104 RepID=UPI00126D7320|nr:flagellar FlbD family protein [Geodermatophilus sp. DSM 44513]WNV76720.1 flagellar FlbD family protein [Geodermatophilus sp. DSM 44513]
MIGLTRRTGEFCHLDPDHIERVEGGHDTVVVTTDGDTYCVRETVDQVIRRIVEDRAGVIAACYVLDRGEDPDPRHLRAFDPLTRVPDPASVVPLRPA